MSLIINGRIHRGDCNISLHETIAPGDVVAVVGPNGAGKSTLLHAIAGLVQIEDGFLSINSQVVDNPSEGIFVAPEDRKIGMVFQSLHLVPQFTVERNVSLALRARGVPAKQAASVVAEKLAHVGAAHLAHRLASELSGGEAQRVALARAIASEPEVLLLDEPLSAIDAVSKEGLRDLLANVLKDFTGTTLLVSHDPMDIASLATRTVALDG